MRIVRDVVIDLHIDDVFEFVADPLNDPRWCAKVISVDQVAGKGPGPGAVYEVVHRPIPLRPPRRMQHTCVGWDAPAYLGWLEEDGADVIHVTYELEPVWTSTRLTQRDDAQLGAARVLHPVMKAGIGRDVARQLKTLKRVLERG